jgi:hypothetical protein
MNQTATKRHKKSRKEELFFFVPSSAFSWLLKLTWRLTKKMEVKK